MPYKKTLVLSSLEGSSEKAVVNVEKFKNRLEGQLRLYNFKQEPSGILTLGILNGENVLKAGLTKKEKGFYSFVLEDETKNFENAKSLTFALVNFKEGKPKPLLFGSSDGKFPTSTEIRLASSLSLFEENLTVEKTKNTLDELGIDYEQEENAVIEQAIDEQMKEDLGCPTCKYRQAFYTEEKEGGEKEEKKNIFYDQVKNQLNELFSSYPEEEFLKNIIPNSKWAKVDYENNGHYYVVGLIYEEGVLKYICYGMPGMWDEKPPTEIEGATQWLPIDPSKPEGFGYYLSYQDAENGESINVEII